MLFIQINFARSQEANLVFSCDFDGTNTCDGELFSNNSGAAQTFSFQQNQLIAGSPVTDISSISKYFLINKS